MAIEIAAGLARGQTLDPNRVIERKKFDGILAEEFRSSGIRIDDIIRSGGRSHVVGYRDDIVRIHADIFGTAYPAIEKCSLRTVCGVNGFVGGRHGGGYQRSGKAFIIHVGAGNGSQLVVADLFTLERMVITTGSKGKTRNVKQDGLFMQMHIQGCRKFSFRDRITAFLVEQVEP